MKPEQVFCFDGLTLNIFLEFDKSIIYCIDISEVKSLLAILFFLGFSAAVWSFVAFFLNLLLLPLCCFIKFSPSLPSNPKRLLNYTKKSASLSEI